MIYQTSIKLISFTILIEKMYIFAIISDEAGILERKWRAAAPSW